MRHDLGIEVLEVRIGGLAARGVRLHPPGRFAAGRQQARAVVV